MKNFSGCLTNLLTAAFVLFLGAIISSLWGALAGWVVGLFFGKTILGIFATIGISGFKMWQIGLFLGFVSAFFRFSYQTSAE